MYVGIDKGKTKAHSKNFLPKKLQVETNQAVEIPIIKVIIEIPTKIKKVL